MRRVLAAAALAAALAGPAAAAAVIECPPSWYPRTFAYDPTSGDPIQVCWPWP